MLRFLRKYNKYILAVFGTLLLITFLVPYAITQIGQASASRGVKWATIGGETLKTTVLNQARNELQLLQSIQQPVGPFGIMDQPAHWYLLVKEADEAGLVGSLSTASFAQLQFANQDPRFVASTFAKLAGVNSLMQLHQDGTPFSTTGLESGRLSDRRVKHIAYERFHNVSVQMVMIKAAAPDKAGTFTQAQLQEQFDKYADKLPGEGEMGFGYRLPNRLKVEWLEISADSVSNMIKASDALNAVDLRKHWNRNAIKFGKPKADAEVPQKVKDDFLQTLTQAKLKEISRFGHNQLRKKQRSRKHLAGTNALPEDWQGLSFVELAQSIQSDFGVPLPAYHAEGSHWLWTGEISDLPGIGQATTTRFGEIPMTLSDIAGAMHEFDPDSTIPIQSKIAGPWLSDPAGNVYFFRFTDADPSRPPHSLDEVKEAVVADLGRIQQYKSLVQAKDAVEKQARDEGLLAVSINNNTVVDSVRSLSISFPSDLPEIGTNEEIIKTIIDRARALPKDVAFDELTDQQKTFVLPVDDKLVLLVVKLVNQSPLTDSFFNIYARAGLLQGSLLENNKDMPTPLEQLAKAFGFEAMMARYDFKFAIEQKPLVDDTSLDTENDSDDDSKG